MQIGAVNADAAKRAEQAGILTVVDLCMLIEYQRLFG